MESSRPAYSKCVPLPNAAKRPALVEAKKNGYRLAQKSNNQTCQLAFPMLFPIPRLSWSTTRWSDANNLHLGLLLLKISAQRGPTTLKGGFVDSLNHRGTRKTGGKRNEVGSSGNRSNNMQGCKEMPESKTPDARFPSSSHAPIFRACAVGTRKDKAVLIWSDSVQRNAADTLFFFLVSERKEEVSYLLSFFSSFFLFLWMSPHPPLPSVLVQPRLQCCDLDSLCG